MLKKVIMPTLGVGMEEALIGKWLKSEGDQVDQDEPLLILETDKATTEIVAPASGVLRQILQPEGATVPVTQTIAVIETAEPASPLSPLGEGRGPLTCPRGEGIPLGNARAEDHRAAGDRPLPQDGREGPTEGLSPRLLPPSSPPGAVRASPAARRAARDLGVDLALVKGTGPAGRVQGEDVRRFAENESGADRPERAEAPGEALAPAEVPAVPPGLPGRLVPLGRKRRVTAERMALSSHTVARLTLNVEVDATELIRLRSRLLPFYEARGGARLSYDAVLAKVVATALADHPYLNARWTDQGIYLVTPINVGVAMAVEDGLVVLVVHDADRKPLSEISQELSGLQAKAREDRLTFDDLSGGTFTITNLGMFGIDSFVPLVNPPEAAILGVGRIVEKPVGRDGQIVLRPLMTLSLSVDHRVVDGAPAARFLQGVKERLEEPLLLI